MTPMNMGVSSSWGLFPAAQRERREAPAPPKPGDKQPANGGDKTAPQRSVKQDKEGKAEEQGKKKEDEKKAEEEAVPVPAVSTKKTEETEFNVRRVWLFW